MANKKFIDENFDVKELKEIGFLKNIKDYDYIEKRLLEFFNLKYIEQYLDIMNPKTELLKADNIFSLN